MKLLKVKKFSCRPKKEPFCCYTERIDVFPREVREHRERWERGGALLVTFRGVFKERENHKKSPFSTTLVNGLKAKLFLQFFPLTPVPGEELSLNFKNYLRERFNIKGNLTFKCPFLENGRCSIYKDRPLFCRLFPIGPVFNECFVCAGEQAFQEGRPIKKLQEVRKRLISAHKKDFEEWNKIVRSLFEDEEVLTEVTEVLKDISKNPRKFYLMTRNPRYVTVLGIFTRKVHQLLGINPQAQFEVFERALLLAKEKGETVYERAYLSIYRTIKSAYEHDVKVTKKKEELLECLEKYALRD